LAEQRFQSFLTRIRPHRVAIFANSADRHWYHNCLGIIEFLTKLWGGSHSVIIPTDGETIDEEFWSILSSHDPDILLRYQPTGEDHKTRAPEEFEQLVLKEAKRYAQGHSLNEDQARSQIEKAILDANFDEWTISDMLRGELLKRLAPFHFEKQPLHGMPDAQLNISAITKGSKPGYPLTSIMEVLRAGNPRSQVTQLGVDDATNTAPPKLWLAATIGCGDDDYFKELIDQQIMPVWTTVDEHVSLNTLIKSGSPSLDRGHRVHEKPDTAPPRTRPDRDYGRQRRGCTRRNRFRLICVPRCCGGRRPYGDKYPAAFDPRA